MTIEKINPWISLATNFGVLIGIALLVIEIGQNTKALELQVDEANTAQWVAWSRTIATSPDLADLIGRGEAGLENLTPEDQLRYTHHLGGFLAVAELTYRSVQQGQYDYDVNANVAALIEDTMSNAGAREYYQSSRSYFSSDFAEWVDQIIIENES